MKHFKCSLRMCFPHKVWVKEWQTYHNKTHDNIKCKEKYHIDCITPPVTYVYDDNTRHCCFVCKTPRPDALVVNNWNAYHVCVDGGLIRFGCRNYMCDYKYYEYYTISSKFSPSDGLVYPVLIKVKKDGSMSRFELHYPKFGTFKFWVIGKENEVYEIDFGR